MFTEEEGMIQKETGGGVHEHSTEEEGDSCPRCSGRDTLKALSISMALIGSGEFHRKSQNCKFIYGSWRNKETSKN